MKATQELHPLQVNVRSAKDRFSKLIELASHGEDVIITSDGKPKARLTAIGHPQKAFHVNWKLLHTRPSGKTGKLSEEIIREERDSRD